MELLNQIRRARQSKDTLHYAEMYIRAESGHPIFWPKFQKIEFALDKADVGQNVSLSQERSFKVPK